MIEGLFENTARAKASVVFLKSAEITNVYIHSRVRYGLYHMTFVRKVVDNPARQDFAYYKSFPTVAIKTSPNFIAYHQINRDVRERYKQCMMRKLCTLVLTLKGYLVISSSSISCFSQYHIECELQSTRRRVAFLEHFICMVCKTVSCLTENLQHSQLP